MTIENGMQRGFNEQVTYSLNRKPTLAMRERSSDKKEGRHSLPSFCSRCKPTPSHYSAVHLKYHRARAFAGVDTSVDSNITPAFPPIGPETDPLHDVLLFEIVHNATDEPSGVPYAEVDTPLRENVRPLLAPGAAES